MKQWLPILLIGWFLGIISTVPALYAQQAPSALPQRLLMSGDASTLYLLDGDAGALYRYNSTGRLVDSFRIAALGEALVKQ